MEQQLSDLNNLKAYLRQLLKEQKQFVLFRYPNDVFWQCFLVQPEGSQTFTLHEFDGESIHLSGELLQIDNKHVLPTKDVTSTVTENSVQASWYMKQTDYENYVDYIKKKIAQGEITKCVAARIKKVDKPANFDALDTFSRMSDKYLKAFCYLANTNAGLWMGATPELLLKTSGKQAQTMALAGTKLNTDISPWSTKEYEEQAIVTEYILAKLNHENIQHIERGEVYEAKAGHLKHLKTDIQFEASPKALHALHPTPAVCGIPVSTAKSIIKKFERGQRSLYAGYLGLDGQNASYFVNLRCMRIEANHIDLFVGAGITQDSDSHAEWLETEAKADTMKNILS